MGVRIYTEARAEANKRYDEKTYKKINVALRLDDDADIIEDMELAKENGLSLRQWLRNLFDNQG